MGDWISYYFVPDTSPFLPFENRFTSEIWDDVHWWGEGAGEAWDRAQPWYSGRLPGPFVGGGRFCGRADWFADGCPSDAPPVPRTPGGLAACCFAGPLTGAYDLEYSKAFDRLRVT